MEKVRQCCKCSKSLLLNSVNFKETRGSLTKTCVECLQRREKMWCLSTCKHNKLRRNCSDCGGWSLCTHGVSIYSCKDCGGHRICEHGIEKYSCKNCGGSQICEHNKRKQFCKTCGGSSICVHKRLKHYCKDCGGSSICGHGKNRKVCKDCGGGYIICDHGKHRKNCKDCGGSSICGHGKIKQICKDCRGSSICEHGKQKRRCLDCGNAIDIKIRSIVYQCKYKDQELGVFNVQNFIDVEYLKNLLKQSNSQCNTCNIKLEFIGQNKYSGRLRLLNKHIGHEKENCVFVCKSCSIKKQSGSKQKQETLFNSPF